MRLSLSNTPVALIAFAAIALLVVGGLGWVTLAALDMESRQLQHAANTERAERLRLAMWQLDSRMGAVLAREDARPFNHYSAVFAPPVSLDAAGTLWPAGSVIEPSPLLRADLPDWMLLHFQCDAQLWQSPQVVSVTLDRWLRKAGSSLSLPNITAKRREFLSAISKELTSDSLIALAQEHVGEVKHADQTILARNDFNNFNANAGVQKDNSAWREYGERLGDQSKIVYQGRRMENVAKNVAFLNVCGNGEPWIAQGVILNNSVQYINPIEKDQKQSFVIPAAPPSSQVAVTMSPMVGVWMNAERLAFIRLVHLEGKRVCQGILLDYPRLSTLLAEEVQTLFPHAKIVPSKEAETPELVMTTLPLRLDPGEELTPSDPGWSTLRVGLCLVWSAALIALMAVGLGGWALVDLSQRRIRFVSAVTHELRTPLTTLRLYLDMLLGGLVREEERRLEYLRTLDSETDRLTRLVGNVLDYSRLENQRPKLCPTTIALPEFANRVAKDWQKRCDHTGKHLVIETEDVSIRADEGLLTQIVGILLDNACKYSQGASDSRLWLRIRRIGCRVRIEVEDRGPGVAMNDRRGIFRAFRRGRNSEATTGGAGLGLALARRWTGLLGGTLTLQNPSEGGACFCVEINVCDTKSTAQPGA
jgi:signal transduction histidine kinase